MAIVIYVHGVGVREQAYLETFGLIKERLRIPDIDFTPCFWGDQFGAKLNADGLSIPVPDIIKAFGDLNTNDDETIALWELLYSDPLCELSAIAMNPGENSKVINFSEEPLNAKLSYEFQNRKFSSKYVQNLAIVGLSDVFEKAYMDTIDSPAFKSALDINPKVIDSERQVIARAVIAKALNMCENLELSLRIMHDTALRDELVALLTDEFGGISKGLSGFILKPFFGLAKSIATNHAARKRRTISAQLYETPGDVLVYMARPAASTAARPTATMVPAFAS
ncbi:MAG: hypothetical protein MUF15_19415 [Acidobacteria bacterium]|nr:hypothetical protein [Acidobacteriota bacterium]